MGHLDIWKFISASVEDKNPKNPKGLTPFHAAAQNGHFDIVRTIMEISEDPNPRLV